MWNKITKGVAMTCPDSPNCNSTDCPHHEKHLYTTECGRKKGPDCPPCVPSEQT